MPSPEFSPEWVLSSRLSETKAQPLDNELRAIAIRLWPRVQAHARLEFANKNSHDSVALATEVWEGVLQSVAKTLQRHDGKGSEIADLEAYLFGAFRHRFNRALKKERRRQETIELIPSTRDLEQLPGLRDAKSPHDLEQSIQVKEVVQNMDDWTRKVWTARQYGYSWREIAEHMGVGEHAAKVRFYHALRRLAARLGFGK
jgi:RNA polymerase sigma factor (sigma-70 family)